MKRTLISVGVALLMAVLAYIAMLIFATGMYVETVGNIIVVTSIGAGIVTALVLQLRKRHQQAAPPIKQTLF